MWWVGSVDGGGGCGGDRQSLSLTCIRIRVRTSDQRPKTHAPGVAVLRLFASFAGSGGRLNGLGECADCALGALFLV
jgi:hypothetical protein